MKWKEFESKIIHPAMFLAGLGVGLIFSFFILQLNEDNLTRKIQEQMAVFATKNQTKPTLEVFLDKESFSLENTLDIEGAAIPGAIVTLTSEDNNLVTGVGTAGYFQFRAKLSLGQNILTFTSVNDYNQEETVTKTVFYEKSKL